MRPVLPLSEVLLVERVIPGGEGFARRPDGRALFVPGAMPGDRVIPNEIDDRGSWGRATRWSLAEPSPERRASPCPLADRCGGCDWIAWSRPAQLAGKAAIVVDALRRTGGETIEPPSIEAPGDELGWRGRIRVQVRDGAIGFLARGSHDVVDVDRCPVATEAVNRGLSALRAVAREHGLPGLQSVELRSAPGGPPVTARLLLDEGAKASGPGYEALARALPADDQRWPLPGGVQLSASVEAFTQVHEAANGALIRKVLRAVGEGTGLVLDACCGAGNFTLPLLAAGRTVHAFDQSRAAVRDLVASAESQGLGLESSRVGRMDRELARYARDGVRFDAIVLDPPRKGARDAIAALARLRPGRIVYVACDPVSLARDTKSLRKAGYRLDSLSCVDMFPQTHHVESVGLFLPA